jgi:FkbM family methyltransferase
MLVLALSSFSLGFNIIYMAFLFFQLNRIWRFLFQSKNFNTPPKSLLRVPRHTPGKALVRGYSFSFSDPLSFYWSWDEIFLREIYRFPNPTNGGRILDGGANLGLASLYFLTAYPKAFITAIEPDPDCFGLLQRNLAWASPASILLKNCALAGQRGRRRFYSHLGDAGRLDVPLSPASGGLEVDCLPLDDFLLEPIDFVKLDLEGAETEVLASSRLLHKIHHLFIEHHSFPARPQDLDQALRTLSDAGFRYWIQSQFLPKRPYEKLETNEGMDLQVNIFATNPMWKNDS